MQESVIYQDILEKGQQKGERSLILRQLTRRVGDVPEELRSRIHTLSLEQLETLGEALLDFEAIADLEAWLGSLEQFPDGEAGTVQPKLQPLPILEGYVPEGWKDEIYKVNNRSLFTQRNATQLSHLVLLKRVQRL